MSNELSAKVFTILSSLVEERAGLSYAVRDRDAFAEKVMTRAREAGFESALDYYYFLRYDDVARREFDALVDSLVVTETYFFREKGALGVVVDHFLRPKVETGSRPRVWCAACASGDEPLTLAMLLAEANLLAKVDLTASDLSLRAFERAREMGWGPRSLRALAGTIGERYVRRDGDRARVDERVVDAVRWRRVNLLDASAIAALGTFDVVICRNVLIYFSDETILRVVGSLTSALEPDGRLLVGTSESLMRFGTLLECEERGGSFFYKRSR
jgi:chemotaxis protein methyltransferase CheR